MIQVNNQPEARRSADTGDDGPLGAARRALAACSDEQRWQLVSELVRTRLGAESTGEIALSESDGLTFAFLVPVRRRFDLVERPEGEWEELARSLVGEDDGPTRPVVDLIAALEAAESPADLARRLDELWASDR